MSAYKLSDTLEIPIHEADSLIDEYFKAFPAIKAFLQFLGDYGTQHGYIHTYAPYRRTRWFEYFSPTMSFKERGKIERASKNTPIQGSGADMVKEALVQIRREIKDNQLPVRLVMTVHDQIDTECLRSYSEEWASKLTDIMEEVALPIVPGNLLKVDTNITELWKK